MSTCMGHQMYLKFTTPKFYAEQWYCLLVIIKLAKLLVNSFGYLYNEKGQAKVFLSEGHRAVTITEVYPPYRLGKNNIYDLTTLPFIPPSYLAGRILVDPQKNTLPNFVYFKFN